MKIKRELCHSKCARKVLGLSRNGPLGPVSRESRKRFGPEKPVVKVQCACFEKLIFLYVFNMRKAKKIAKFDGLDRRRCEDRKEIAAAKFKISPKKHATGFKSESVLNLFQISFSLHL